PTGRPPEPHTGGGGGGGPDSRIGPEAGAEPRPTTGSRPDPRPASGGRSDLRPPPGSRPEPRPASGSRPNPRPLVGDRSGPRPASDVRLEPLSASGSRPEPRPLSGDRPEPRPMSDVRSEPLSASGGRPEPRPPSGSRPEPRPPSGSGTDTRPAPGSRTEKCPPRASRSRSRLRGRLRCGRPLRPRLLSLGTTFAVAFAAVTATVTLLIGFLSYTAAARLVRVDQQSVFREVVQDLRNEVRDNRMTPLDFSSTAPGHDLVRPARTDVQALAPDREAYDPGRPGLPVEAADRRIAGAATAGQAVEHADVDVGDDVYRVATVSLGGGRGAVQVAQEFSNTEDLLRTLQRRTLVLMTAVVVGAGLFGWWLARRITRRLVVLTRAAEDVARTRRLGIQVPVAGHDEVGRLGRAFDRMLGRLAQPEEDQRRLVQDAGHELRTPLT